jgi:hypothetical protein
MLDRLSDEYSKLEQIKKCQVPEEFVENFNWIIAHLEDAWESIEYLEKIIQEGEPY